MRILLTNDDGPPSNKSAPYVHTLISTLQQAGHQVSVCLPNVQRSWIGKAHMIGQTLTPSYFRPGTILKDDGILSERPFDDGGEQWVLIDGTPASCVQIGLHHVYKDQGPFDLVLSGPNYGRNTTAVFALSSGTIGGAMEGAVNGVKSIALSYAFDSREHNADIIAAASRISTKLIERLLADWPEDVHLYSINVPLREGVEQTKIVYTEMIQNRWYNSSFTEMAAHASDADPNEEEQKIRQDGKEKEADLPKTRGGVTYKWTPQFADVRKAVEESGKGDGWSVIQGHISVTPLRANFWHVSRFSGEIKLDQDFMAMSIRLGESQHKTVCAIVDYPDSYVQPLILQALSNSKTVHYKIVHKDKVLPRPTQPFLQIAAYENLDFEQFAAHPTTSLACAYVIRKALIRKHYLSNTVSTWLVKHPEGVLQKHFKPAVHFELDFAEFLDEALVDAWDLNESMQRNEPTEQSSNREWWILKPGMSDGGNGIRLFSTMEELQRIFEEWDPQSDEEDENEEANQGADHNDVRSLEHGDDDDDGKDFAMTSQLRHFIAQPYIDPPLLLPAYHNRKFHIRTYVVATGALRVYVYKEMLALFAANTYHTPGAGIQLDGPTSEGRLAIDLSQHLTNTCFQDESTRSSSVHRFWALQDNVEAETATTAHTDRKEQVTLRTDWKEHIFAQISQVTGETMEAAAREQMIHFQTTPNAFEIFGVDFLVDSHLDVWLLEFNAYPDFKQTGADLQGRVVGGLFEEVVKVAVDPFFGDKTYRNGTEMMVMVKDLDLGRG